MWQKSVTVCKRHNLSLAVREWSRRGVPCVLVHGFGDASCVWDHLAVRLAQQFRVLAMDLRGHGNSDWDPEARYDTATFVKDLSKIIAAFDLDPTMLVAHSLGADVAIRFAAEHTDRVLALVIIDYGPELDKASVDELVWNFNAMPRVFRTPEMYAQWLIERRPLADPALLRHFASYNLRQSPPNWELKSDAALATQSQINKFEVAENSYLSPDLWPALARIKCPTLVVRGMGSGVLGHDVANRMVERTLSDGRLTLIAGAGHSVMMDNPTELTASVAGFLAGVAAQKRPANDGYRRSRNA